MALTAGDEYVLIAAEGFGQGIGALVNGQRVLVEDVHTEPVAGVGGDVVISFPEEPVVVEGEEIVPVRRIALSLEDFESMFEPAGDN